MADQNKNNFALKPNRKIGYLVIALELLIILIGIYGFSAFIADYKDKEVYKQKLVQDREQNKNLDRIRNSLKLYANDHNGIYPVSLNEIAPKYIEGIPQNMETKQSYDYRQLDDGKDFNICAYFAACGGVFCYSKSPGFVQCEPPT